MAYNNCIIIIATTIMLSNDMPQSFPLESLQAYLDHKTYIDYESCSIGFEKKDRTILLLLLQLCFVYISHSSIFHKITAILWKLNTRSNLQKGT